MRIQCPHCVGTLDIRVASALGPMTIMSVNKARGVTENLGIRLEIRGEENGDMSKIKHEVTFWAESATEWRGKLEPFDDGHSWHSRMIEMEHVAHQHGIGHRREGRTYVWTFPTTPTKAACRSIKNMMDSKWHGTTYKFTLILPKEDFLSTAVDVSAAESPEPITTSEEASSPEPVEAATSVPVVPGLTTTTPAIGIGAQLTGNIMSAAPVETMSTMFEEFAQLMDKHRVNAINLSWRRYD